MLGEILQVRPPRRLPPSPSFSVLLPPSPSFSFLLLPSPSFSDLPLLGGIPQRFDADTTPGLLLPRVAHGAVAIHKRNVIGERQRFGLRVLELGFNVRSLAGCMRMAR